MRRMKQAGKETWIKIIKKRGFHFFIVLAIFLPAGCGEREQQAASVSEGVSVSEEVSVAEEAAASEEEKDTLDTDSYALLTDDLIRWDQIKETETEDYYIVAVQEENKDGKIVEYPQIIPKEGAEIFCGTELINARLATSYWQDYNILYADRHYISLWRGGESGEERTSLFNLQCQNAYARDDNDYRDAPWPSGEVPISLDAVLEEIEKGNCRTDEAGYAIYREDPEAFIGSVRRQFKEIKEGGYEEAYWTREDSDYSKKAYRMYLREDRVGFYIHPIEVWEETESKRFYHSSEHPIDTSRDFRIEVPYDWKKDAPAYHMPYEVYGELCESETYGTFYYPQIRGLDETITASLNAAMKEDLNENLAYMDLDVWNEKMVWYTPYGVERYFEKLPPVLNPEVTYRTEKYLCIHQDIYGPMLERICMTDAAWKRYHVYDLETGKSLRLGDVIRVDEAFVTWLKQEKKVDARLSEITGWEEEMDSVNDPAEWMKKELDDYPADLLLSVLEDAEFWLKEDNLFIKIPRYNVELYDGLVYLGGGTGHPPIPILYEVRIALDDLQGFLIN